MCVCVCVRAHARPLARSWMCVCVWERERESVCVVRARVRACVFVCVFQRTERVCRWHSTPNSCSQVTAYSVLLTSHLQTRQIQCGRRLHWHHRRLQRPCARTIHLQCHHWFVRYLLARAAWHHGGGRHISWPSLFLRRRDVSVYSVLCCVCVCARARTRAPSTVHTVAFLAPGHTVWVRNGRGEMRLSSDYSSFSGALLPSSHVCWCCLLVG